MKYFLIFFILSLQFLCFSQWSSILHIPNLADVVLDMRYLDFNTNENGKVVGYYKRTDVPVYKTVIYNTNNGGNSWDTVYIDNGGIPCGLDVVSDNITYFSTTWTVVSPNNVIYQKVSVFRTFNNGISWEEKVVDTLGNGSQHEGLKFLNDSTGVLAVGSGLYLTKDYGDSWQIIDSSFYLKYPVISDNNIYLFAENQTFSYNLQNFQRSEFTIDQNVNGPITRTNSFENTILTSAYGVHEEPNNNYNYISLIIDELPLGNPKNIRINDQGATDDIELTDNNLFLVINAIYRSTDSGDSFYKQTTLESEGFDNTWVERCVFPSDTVGYIITWNQSLGYKIQKTTNAGGVTTDYLPNVTEYLAKTEDKHNYEKYQIFPNPASSEIKIQYDLTQTNYKEVLIEIKNMTGQIVAIYKLNPYIQSATFDINNLANGVYLIHLKEGKNLICTEKLIIKR